MRVALVVALALLLMTSSLTLVAGSVSAGAQVPDSEDSTAEPDTGDPDVLPDPTRGDEMTESPGDVLSPIIDQEGKCKRVKGIKKVGCWLKVLFGKCKPTAPTPVSPNTPYGVSCTL